VAPSRTRPGRVLFYFFARISVLTPPIRTFITYLRPAAQMTGPLYRLDPELGRRSRRLRRVDGSQSHLTALAADLGAHLTAATVL